MLKISIVPRETNHRVKNIRGSNIFIDPQTSDQRSNNRFNAFHISDIYKCFQQTAWLPQLEKWSSCNSFLLVSTFPSLNNQDIGVGGCKLPDYFNTSSLSHFFLYSPSTSNSLQEFHKNYEAAPTSSPPPPAKCDLFLKKYVGMCHLQWKGLKSLGLYCPLSS